MPCSSASRSRQFFPTVPPHSGPRPDPHPHARPLPIDAPGSRAAPAAGGSDPHRRARPSPRPAGPPSGRGRDRRLGGCGDHASRGYGPGSGRRGIGTRSCRQTGGDGDHALGMGQRARRPGIGGGCFERRHVLLDPGGAAAGSTDLDPAGDHHLCRPARRHLFDRLHARRPRLSAILRPGVDVRVLDDDARGGEQLPARVRLLGGGGGLQLPADRLLVHQARGGQGRQEGFSRQPRRRLRPRGGHVLALDDLRHAQLPRHVARRRHHRAGHSRSDPARRCRGLRRRCGRHRDLPAAPARRLWQERPTPAARLAARRHGRPHAGQRPDPRCHDGDGRHLPRRPLGTAVRRLPRRPDAGVGRGSDDGPDRGADRHRAERPQTGARLLHDQPARLHVREPRHRHASRLHRRDLPSRHPRVLQGAALHGGRLGDALHGGRDRHATVRWPAAGDADHGGHLPGRLARPGGRGPIRRLL